MAGFLDRITDVGMAIGPVTGYVAQYFDIAKRRSAEGFSLLVPVVLITSNVLRIVYWFGLEEKFETALLWQAVFMIIMQLLLLELSTRLSVQSQGPGSNNPTAPLRGPSTAGEMARAEMATLLHAIRSPLGLVLFTAVAGFGLIAPSFIGNPSFVTLIGYLSLLVESTLAMPQAYYNFTHRSTEGLSFVLVGTWFVGDMYKFVYFIMKSQPIPFILCATIQLTVDAIVGSQIVMYRSNTKSGEKKSGRTVN